ncbi:putative proteasome subunit beta type-7 [Astathelohania contejeani]|uniref:Proteasome subunit beta n=1 Tax=Astathelohania contejeani TaxID=164912 RepID=A0ABQ7I2S7_9MICR|nr:putative proteasome subunit beta type-7 [Thelohania contejeani]
MKRYVVGSTVVAFKYSNGILIAADTQGSYGGMTMYKNIQKIYKLADNCLIGFSGECSDMQYVVNFLNLENEKEAEPLTPQGYHKLVQRMYYGKRSKLNPLNLFSVVAGINKKYDLRMSTDDRGRMLGAVDHLGSFYFSSVICSGMGAYLITPFLRERVVGRENELSRQEAIEIAEECMKILFYRDTSASGNISIAYVEDNECIITEPYSITPKTKWNIGSVNDI